MQDQKRQRATRQHQPRDGNQAVPDPLGNCREQPTDQHPQGKGQEEGLGKHQRHPLRSE